MYVNALASTLRSKRFWVWQIGGALIYAIPVLIRVATGNVLLPVLSLLEHHGSTTTFLETWWRRFW